MNYVLFELPAVSSRIKLNSLSQQGRGKNLFLFNDFCITVFFFFFFFNLFQLKLKQINSEHALKSHLTGPEMFAYFL